MKLPDFTDDPGLVALRRLMGASEPGGFAPAYRPGALTQDELDRLAGGGIDVSFDEITELEDGTLGYKDSRVLVYIRDVATYGGQFQLPKFHVAYCSTLDQMKRGNRFERYVVATRENGDFHINKIDNGRQRASSWERLNVCQNCLNALSFDHFSYFLGAPRRNEIVRNFTIARFFEKYPRSLHLRRPRHDNISAPVNDYSYDFGEIATRIKEERDWKCEKCSLNLSPPDQRRFLQVHHKNGLKYDNDPSNLQALCLKCHAEEFQHSHIKRTPGFEEFQRRYR